MTMWELAACVDGYNRAHGPEQAPPAPTDAEFEQLKRQAGY